MRHAPENVSKARGPFLSGVLSGYRETTLGRDLEGAAEDQGRTRPDSCRLEFLQAIGIDDIVIIQVDHPIALGLLQPQIPGLGHAEEGTLHQAARDLRRPEEGGRGAVFAIFHHQDLIGPAPFGGQALQGPDQQLWAPMRRDDGGDIQRAHGPKDRDTGKDVKYSKLIEITCTS